MSYQMCPKCKGKGTMWKSGPEGTQLSAYETKCGICNGKQIIHTETAKPPKGN